MFLSTRTTQRHCALKFDQETWQLQLTAIDEFGFIPDSEHDDEAALKEFEDLWGADDDDIPVREGACVSAWVCVCVSFK